MNPTTEERTQTETAPLENVVQQTENYDQFRLLDANREVNRRHVLAIQKSFETDGNFTQAQPILVNERFEVIDGQHRLEAARGLGTPVYYTVVPGLTAVDARKMNQLHKTWTPKDYLRAHIAAGSRAYILFNTLAEEFPQLPITTLISYANNKHEAGLEAKFRRGDMRFTVEMFERAQRNLVRLMEIAEINKAFLTKAMSLALLAAINSGSYRHRKMLEKVASQGADMAVYQTVKDNIRQLENAYNWHVTPDNHVRFF